VALFSQRQSSAIIHTQDSETAAEKTDPEKSDTTQDSDSEETKPQEPTAEEAPAEETAAEETAGETETREATEDKADAEESGTAQESDGEESQPQESDVSVEQKDAASEANTADNVAEEKATAPKKRKKKRKKSKMVKVSETIQKMAQSPAALPGESGQPRAAKNAAPSDTGELLWMCARDVMQSQVVWASPDDSVQQTLAKMQQHDAGYIMIGQDGVLEGIVSKSDITGAISPYLRPIFTKWRGPSDDATLKIKIKWIMSRPVRTVRPETSLATAMENMCRFGGRALPVVDEQAKVQGLVTAFDIFRMLLNTNADVSTVGKTPQGPPLA
jgi:CBS domain-containing protein